MINYITGSALEPIGDGNKVIAHVCNNAGGWGAGFVVAISKKWSLPEADYREWFRRKGFHGNKFALGNIDLVRVSDITSDNGKEIYVANMIAQHGYDPKTKPIRYPALYQCLQKVADFCLRKNCSVHMPRIGCGLAGGEWKEIEKIVQSTLIDKGIETYVYTLEGDTSWK